MDSEIQQATIDHPDPALIGVDERVLNYISLLVMRRAIQMIDSCTEAELARAQKAMRHRGHSRSETNKLDRASLVKLRIKQCGKDIWASLQSWDHVAAMNENFRRGLDDEFTLLGKS